MRPKTLHTRSEYQRTREHGERWRMLIHLSPISIPSAAKASLQSSTVMQASMLQNGVEITFTRSVNSCLPDLAFNDIQYLLSSLHESPAKHVPDVFNETFHKVDQSLSKMCEESEGKIHSGCTAVTAFLRIEDANGRQPFLDTLLSTPPTDLPTDADEFGSAQSSGAESDEFKKRKSSSGSRIRAALKNFTSGGSSSTPATPRSSSPLGATGVTITIPPVTSRRMLYTANAGDARAVLCRNGKAIRLTYDHKGSDKREAKRITDAGGFVMSGRVNGVLAVTRSLGDSAMKEFVVGSPYTTETELSDEDEFLILACDGVSFWYFFPWCLTFLFSSVMGRCQRSECYRPCA